MKKLLRTAFRVPGCCCLVVVAAAASIQVLTPVHGVVAEVSAQPDRHHQLAAVSRQRGMPYVPVQAKIQPALWTVRTRFDDLIASTARLHDMDPALVKAIVQAESAFNPEAVSHAGAQGLMQVLPATASRFAIDNLSDPRENLRAGVLYLKHLLKLFDGDVTMAVAAYNAGPNTVRRYRGVPPYSETRSYLAKVMGLRDAYADQLRRS